MSTLIVNGVEMPCLRVREGNEVYNETHFFVNYPIADAIRVFVNGAVISVVWADGKTSDYSEYKLLMAISYLPDGTLDVCYRRLTDTEKLIELHYGGVN